VSANLSNGIMGRIKNTTIKRTVDVLIEQHGQKFSNDFYTNKKIISELVDLNCSKKIKNMIVGCITHKMKKTAVAQ
jgi:small subunit ribosomal protein S17e